MVNLIPCGSNSYATLDPGDRGHAHLSSPDTASGGTTTESPALGRASTPPKGPMVDDRHRLASGVLRSSGVTVAG